MNAILTGSWAYGCSEGSSDVDLVIRCTEEEASMLHGLSDNPREAPTRFGKLNLILCTNDDQFAAWYMGTRRLQRMHKKTGRPITREVAVDMIKSFRHMLGQESPDVSSPTEEGTEGDE